ncbi:MAG: YidC/Oxa1 family membrane protein insertase [Dehalococcoidia bacterium]|nr:YidC/Oxa1 family membrane protein insertase [Dehalococcoidia bacterium]
MSAQPASAPRPGRFSPFAAGMFLVIAVFLSMLVFYGFSNTFNLLLIDPLINALLLLNLVVLGQFGLAILLFTLLLRLATLPFTIRQLQSTKAMQTAQPQMQEIQKKYKDPKRRQEEMLKLYREHNINPLGCFLPMVIQMVVFIALYRSLVFVVGGSPESLVALSQRLYPISFLQNQVPLEQHFLYLNLGQPDTTFILPLIVGLSTYIQQKMSQTPNASAQQQLQQQMMMWMMPMMLVFFTLNLPSGVGVYWVASNVFSLFASYYVYGRRVLSWRYLLLPGPAPEPAPAARKPTADSRDQEARDNEEPAPAAPVERVRPSHGKRRGKRKNRR